MIQNLKLKIPFGLSIFVLGLLALGSLAFATATITESYKSENPITAGSVVSLKNEANRVVEPASQKEGSEPFGVAVLPTDSDLRISEDKQEGENDVYVTTLGTATVFVTDVNGTINVGDDLAVSPISGVAMKASAGTAVIGVAGEDFTGEEAKSTTQVKVENGDTINAKIGTIDAQIQITGGTSADSEALQTLQTFAERVAGKSVSFVRLMFALIVLAIVLVVGSVLIIASVRSSLTSIGRNPLSRKSVYKGLIGVVLVAIVIFLAGMGAAYLILRI